MAHAGLGFPADLSRESPADFLLTPPRQAVRFGSYVFFSADAGGLKTTLSASEKPSLTATMSARARAVRLPPASVSVGLG